jgi:hypothetical protein
VELLLPLVRVRLTCMSVDSLLLLQAEAVGELLSLADGFSKLCSVNACMCPASIATQPLHAAFQMESFHEQYYSDQLLET